jgi:hypothetical protein
MSEGWDIVITPSSDKMLSKKEETSLAVEGGISATKELGSLRKQVVQAD